ncbi:hypothetical protein BD626DRAFT_571123 [Schizophyllum amplum]|uniref:Uncharacterized protein n=1 Tax=Schizophyllum amplum TaxID=97359 RepID=A0A550C8F8_9AGAR|nr:hypothetical protein BD626DRAFT_571123 [Auriculariopsis ampla]
MAAVEEGPAAPRPSDGLTGRVGVFHLSNTSAEVEMTPETLFIPLPTPVVALTYPRPCASARPPMIPIATVPPNGALEEARSPDAENVVDVVAA